MKPSQADSKRPVSDRKIVERALIMLLVGCLLLTPPLAGIFQIDDRIMGIPFTGLYLFFVWGALIAGAAALSGRLQRHIDSDNPDEQTTGEAMDRTE